jgi:hypothetical protein
MKSDEFYDYVSIVENSFQLEKLRRMLNKEYKYTTYSASLAVIWRRDYDLV